jgi:hypothetical protein
MGINMSDYGVNNANGEGSKLILTEETFIEKMRELEIDETSNRKVNKIFQYVNSLKSSGILPLCENNKILPVLARIIGFLYADGSLNIYSKNRSNKYKYKEFQCAFDFGRLNDAMQFQSDIELCGFNPVKILEGTRSFTHKDGTRVQTHHTFTCTYNGCLPAFLISLGISYGKKTETARNPIPEWIMNSTEYSRQFIKGFQGGDGSKISWHRTVDKRNKKGTTSYLIRSAETSQQINPIYQESLMTFMQQCVSILNALNVKVTSDIKNSKISDNRIKLAFTISSNSENLINYFDRIGYAYAETKTRESFKVVEYLKSKKMNSVEKFMNIETWIYDVIEEKNGCLFVPIESIIRQPDGLISDIEC